MQEISKTNFLENQCGDISFNDLYQNNIRQGVLYPNYITDGSKVCKITKEMNDDGHFIWKKNQISNHMKVLCIENNQSNQKVMYLLEYINTSGEVKNIEVEPFKITIHSEMIKLSTFGVDVHSNNVKELTYYLNNSIKTAKTIRIIDTVGIVNEVNKTHFVCSRTSTRDTEKVKWTQEELTYRGNLAILKDGILKNYKRMIKREVLGNVNLELMLTLGLSAAIVGYVGKELDVPNILVHLVGDSSTGKTTAIELALSTFGACKHIDDKDSLLSTWNATENSLGEFLVGNHGIPIGLDELGASQIKDFTKVIYNFQKGIEKKRMNIETGNNKQKSWNTTIISTGEKSILDASDNSTGLGVRVLEFHNVKWTKSSMNSDNIKRCTKINYGIIGSIFAKKMLKKSKQSIIKDIKKIRNSISPELENECVGKRISMILALIVFTAQLISENLKIEVNVEDIKKLLIQNTNETMGKNASLSQKAFEYIKGYVTANQNYFDGRKYNPLKTKSESISECLFGTIYGSIYKDTNGRIVEIVIIYEEFEKILKAGNFLNPNAVLGALKRDGFLNCEKGKNTRKRQIANLMECRCIVIKYV